MCGVFCFHQKTPIDQELSFYIYLIKEAPYEDRTQSKKKRTRPLLAGQYRHICQAVPLDYLDENRSEYDISLRVVRFEISPGCFENIITNLPGFPTDS